MIALASVIVIAIFFAMAGCPLLPLIAGAAALLAATWAIRFWQDGRALYGRRDERWYRRL